MTQKKNEILLRGRIFAYRHMCVKRGKTYHYFRWLYVWLCVSVHSELESRQTSAPAFSIEVSLVALVRVANYFSTSGSKFQSVLMNDAMTRDPPYLSSYFRRLLDIFQTRHSHSFNNVYSRTHGRGGFRGGTGGTFPPCPHFWQFFEKCRKLPETSKSGEKLFS